MDHNQVTEMVEVMKPYYMPREELDDKFKRLDKQLSSGETNFAVLNFQMKMILAGIAAIIVLLVPVVLSIQTGV